MRRYARCPHGTRYLHLIGNNGWIISTNSPQYMPIFQLNCSATLRAEAYGFDFGCR